MDKEQIINLTQAQNTMRGYVYPYEGYRRDFWFEGTPENIANFIMMHSDADEIVITNTWDNLVLNTKGMFIDGCPNQELLREILPFLIPLQMGEKEVAEIEIVSDEDVEQAYQKNNSMNMS